MSCPHLNCFFQCPAEVFNFLRPRFLLPIPSHRNHGTLKFDIVMSKFQKMFDEDSILQIRGSSEDCDWGGGLMKIVAEKIKPTFSIFLARFSSPIEGPARIAIGGGECVGGLVMKIVTEKIKPFSIFSLVIFVTQFPPIISFQNLIFSKCLTKTQYREFEDPAIVMGGNWVMKIVAEKIENVSSIFLATIFVTEFPPLQLQDPEIRDIVYSSNILRICFQFFSHDFCHPISPITIAGPSNLRYCVFEGPAIVIG